MNLKSYFKGEKKMVEKLTALKNAERQNVTIKLKHQQPMMTPQGPTIDFVTATGIVTDVSDETFSMKIKLKDGELISATFLLDDLIMVVEQVESKVKLS